MFSHPSRLSQPASRAPWATGQGRTRRGGEFSPAPFPKEVGRSQHFSGNGCARRALAPMSSSFLRAAATRALDAATPVGVAKARTLPYWCCACLHQSTHSMHAPQLGGVRSQIERCSLPPINLPMEKPQRVRQRSAAEQAALEDEMADMYAQLGVDRNADLMSALKPS